MKRDGAIAAELVNRGPWPLVVVALAVAAMATGVYVAAQRDTSQVSSTASTASSPDWRVHVTRVDDAIAHSSMTIAAYHWQDAYGAALRSRRWDALIEVGAAAVRIAATRDMDHGFRIEARRAYRAALARARAEKSPDGLRRVARAFRDLGDHEAAAQAERLAEQR